MSAPQISDVPCERCESSCVLIDGREPEEYRCSGCGAEYTLDDHERQRKRSARLADKKAESVEAAALIQCYYDSIKRIPGAPGGSGDKGPKMGKVIYIPDPARMDPEQERNFIRQRQLNNIVTVPLKTDSKEVRQALHTELIAEVQNEAQA